MKIASKISAIVAVLGILLGSQGVNGQDSDKEVVQLKTVSLTKTGSLVGRISTASTSFKSSTPASNIKVSISRNGSIIEEAKTDKDGQFEISGVSPGPYSLLAVGESALLATGINVVENEGNAAFVNLIAMPAPFDAVDAVLRSNSEAWKRTIPLRKVDTDKVEVLSASVISPSLPEGTISGQIADLEGNVADANVFLIREDQIVAKTSSIEGEYALKNVKAGVYSLLTVSKNGFAVVAIEVKKQVPITKVSFIAQEGANVTLAQGGTFQLYVQADDEEEDDVPPPIVLDAPIVAGPAGGGVGGGGIGFGGGAAGLAGLGGLAGLAGLGDDDASPK